MNNTAKNIYFQKQLVILKMFNKNLVFNIFNNLFSLNFNFQLNDCYLVCLLFKIYKKVVEMIFNIDINYNYISK